MAVTLNVSIDFGWSWCARGWCSTKISYDGCGYCCATK